MRKTVAGSSQATTTAGVPKIYSFAELKSATNNFKNVLGEGRFGKVYRGRMEGNRSSKSTESGSTVAVKKLNSKSIKGVEEWHVIHTVYNVSLQNEVNILGRLSHPNLVKLLGYCHDGEELLLVYEFMQRGSFDNHLFGRRSTVEPLTWDIRLKVAIGAARGLSFLHNLDRSVIYRDFKTSNILLDESYNAKLVDFGLAKMESATESHVPPAFMYRGTYGYAAPEYVSTGYFYVKSDVYGFGVVLVEILTGMRALDNERPAAQQVLVNWVKPYLEDGRKIKNIMDPRLDGRYPLEAATSVAQLALTCLVSQQAMRPSMKEVVATLERLEHIKEKPKVPRIHNSSSRSPYKYGH